MAPRAPAAWTAAWHLLRRCSRAEPQGVPAEVAERTDFLPGVVWSWRTHAGDVCDGGPAFFGMEYDVETGRFDPLDFNGAL